MKPRQDRSAIYCRVSGPEQAKGWSLDGQLAMCLEHNDRQGYRNVRRYSDVCSGRSLDRPGFQRLIDVALTGALDVVVVWRRDRLGRDSADMGVLVKLLRKVGVRVESIVQGPQEDTHHTRFINRIFDAVAELEAEEIAERCKLGRDTAAQSGIWPTKPPYGYIRRKDKSLAPHAEEALLVQAMFQDVARGEPCRNVAQYIGCTHTTVGYRIRNPAYKGHALYGAHVVPMPALVTEAQWDAANAVLDAACRYYTRRPLRTARVHAAGKVDVHGVSARADERQHHYGHPQADALHARHKVRGEQPAPNRH